MINANLNNRTQKSLILKLLWTYSNFDIQLCFAARISFDPFAVKIFGQI